jgi:hypothetical protein
MLKLQKLKVNLHLQILQLTKRVQTANLYDYIGTFKSRFLTGFEDAETGEVTLRRDGQR